MNLFIFVVLTCLQGMVSCVRLRNSIQPKPVEAGVIEKWIGQIRDNVEASNAQEIYQAFWTSQDIPPDGITTDGFRPRSFSVPGKPQFQAAIEFEHRVIEKQKFLSCLEAASFFMSRHVSRAPIVKDRSWSCLDTLITINSLQPKEPTSKKSIGVKLSSKRKTAPQSDALHEDEHDQKSPAPVLENEALGEEYDSAERDSDYYLVLYDRNKLIAENKCLLYKDGVKVIQALMQRAVIFEYLLSNLHLVKPVPQPEENPKPLSRRHNMYQEVEFMVYKKRLPVGRMGIRYAVPGQARLSFHYPDLHNLEYPSLHLASFMAPPSDAQDNAGGDSSQELPATDGLEYLKDDPDDEPYPSGVENKIDGRRTQDDKIGPVTERAPKHEGVTFNRWVENLVRFGNTPTGLRTHNVE